MWLSYDGSKHETWDSEPVPASIGDYFVRRGYGKSVQPILSINSTNAHLFNLPDMEPMTCIELESITFKEKE